MPSEGRARIVPQPPRPPERRSDVVRAVLVVVAITVAFVAAVLTLKGAVAGILVVGYLVWLWLYLRRRRAVRRARARRGR
jgi:Flp pilus assembly protein TadB